MVDGDPTVPKHLFSGTTNHPTFLEGMPMGVFTFPAEGAGDHLDLGVIGSSPSGEGKRPHEEPKIGVPYRGGDFHLSEVALVLFQAVATSRVSYKGSLARRVGEILEVLLRLTGERGGTRWKVPKAPIVGIVVDGSGVEIFSSPRTFLVRKAGKVDISCVGRRARGEIEKVVCCHGSRLFEGGEGGLLYQKVAVIPQVGIGGGMRI